MAKMRAERLAELIKEEISNIIFREVKDPRIGFLSITDVEVSRTCGMPIFMSVFMVRRKNGSQLWKAWKRPKALSENYWESGFLSIIHRN